MSEEYEEIENEENEEDEVDRGDLVIESDEDEEDEDEVNEEDEGQENEVDDEEEEDSSEENVKIPKARLDEVIAQREAQKDRVQWLEDQLETLINQKKEPVAQVETPPKEAYNFTEAEEQYANLLIEGETGKAAALRSTIDSARKDEFAEMIKTIKEESVTEATSKSTEAIEQDKFDALIGNFENKHDFLDADSDNYNEDAVETINTLLSGYMASGKSKTEALKLSVKKVVPMYDTTPPAKKVLGDTRKTKALKKAAKASNSQPAKSSSKGLSDTDPETVDLVNMSERAYNKLTAKEKKILRGD